MHTEMWEQPSVQENLATLRRRGVIVLEPDEGPLAGGDSGKGRLPDPERIAALVLAVARGYRGPLSGRRVVVSAGGTREPIDPVRVITNNSSGRQGHAIAEVAVRLGAEVTLVTTSDAPLAPDVVRGVRVVSVTTAHDMHVALTRESRGADVVVMSAAVADFTVEAKLSKIKKEGGVPSLTLVPTVDILSELVASRAPGQVIVGFAAETTDVMLHAREKMARKGCDLLVVNDVTADGVGFNHATNAVVILESSGVETEVPLTSKEEVAYQLLSKVSERF
jgi:phosphopantothenoylcysteine decarboxylase/phosphopantothenate--cysteine ligase